MCSLLMSIRKFEYILLICQFVQRFGIRFFKIFSVGLTSSRGCRDGGGWHPHICHEGRTLW